MTPQELKASILQLAMQGKITEQLPTDGSAQDLLGKLHIDKKIIPAEAPFDIPENWLWIPVGNLGASLDTDSFSDGPFGSNLKTAHQISSPEVRIIQLSNIGEDGWKDKNVKYTSFEHLETVIPRCEVHPGDFVIAKMMPAGRTIQVPKLGTRITLGSDAMKFVPNPVLDKQYLLYAMRSQAFLGQVYAEAHGITRVRTTLNGVKSYVLPIPPLAEQKRIVAKIEELLPYIDRYEQAWSKLADFNKRFPVDMQKSILQMAIQGKLVDQRPEEGTGEELYQQIQAEKQRLIKAGTIKKEKPLPEIAEEEIPFDIPESWKWIPLGEIASINGGFAFKSANYTANGVRVVRISDFNESGFVNEKIVRHPYDESLSAYVLEEKNILLCMTGGTVGKSFFVTKLNEKMVVNQRVATIKVQTALPEYVYQVILAPITQKVIQHSKNSTNDNISMDTIKGFLIPLPPLAEQKRIVAKLEEILPLCDSLK